MVVPFYLALVHLDLLSGEGLPAQGLKILLGGLSVRTHYTVTQLLCKHTHTQTHATHTNTDTHIDTQRHTHRQNLYDYICYT